PARRFPNEAAAWERYLKVSGLFGLTPAASKVAARGIVRDGDAWRLAMDPAANDAGGGPAFDALMSAAKCPVHLARGGTAALVTLDETRALDPGAIDLGTYGHNVIVKSPDTVCRFIENRLFR